MRWVLAILVVAAVAAGVMWGDVFQVAASFALALICIGMAWLCERRSAPGLSQAVSAVMFGVAANVVGAGFSLRLLALPPGSGFDSFSGETLRLTFFALAGVAGLALTARALVRARKGWKLLSLAGLALSLTPMIVAHAVYLRVVEARGLHDIW
jgi:hypothetical protein